MRIPFHICVDFGVGGWGEFLAGWKGGRGEQEMMVFIFCYMALISMMEITLTYFGS